VDRSRSGQESLDAIPQNRQWLQEQEIFVEDKIRVNIQTWTLAITHHPANSYSTAN
jgi:hypothetical protein